MTLENRSTISIYMFLFVLFLDICLYTRNQSFCFFFFFFSLSFVYFEYCTVRPFIDVVLLVAVYSAVAMNERNVKFRIYMHQTSYSFSLLDVTYSDVLSIRSPLTNISFVLYLTVYRSNEIFHERERERLVTHLDQSKDISFLFVYH